MKSILVSFATPKWYHSQNLLCDSAKKHGVTGYIKYTDASRNWEFTNKYSDIYKETRGYGFWQWKPKIVLDVMEKLNEGDVVLYVDSGNIIVNNLQYIIDRCVEKEIVLFDNRDGNYEGNTHLNGTWTKRDCFVLMDCDSEQYYNAPQVDASYQIFKKTPRVIEFLKEYDVYCSNENIISDLPNITKPNLPQFKDHRHDQSILSLMAVKHNIDLLPEPSEWGNHLTNRPYPQLFLHHRNTIK
jgi:hypothetical protein